MLVVTNIYFIIYFVYNFTIVRPNIIKILTVCSHYVTYSFQSESTLYSCLNPKKLLVQNRRNIWSSIDCNETRTHNHLVQKGSRWNWSVWLSWVFVFKLSGCGFESRCSHLTVRSLACLEQGVPWYSGNYRVWVRSE